ncbi:MAG: hypothetical protein HY299_22835 [Verrucomicrobia bacterium]|nr:hypothetical protein [Verrucomicrobiota bacterium]
MQESSTQTISGLRTELKAAQLENKLLRQKLDAFIRRCFGKKNEQLSNAQLELLLAGMESAPVETHAIVPKQPVSCPKRVEARKPPRAARAFLRTSNAAVFRLTPSPVNSRCRTPPSFTG